ncbi:hypothetical protein BU23DRAFT_586851 [Bimuria novae-zelandiae CBS 107.79]|uniref:Rhodopsin domain-containing protein n=1 Tax=Bimuria novae-zelandiae CBS 107.79 TaxID=1447943 RepID=A0A6A5VTZ8_9PLEO|nr:hypothetical protein BU23DRAFT_586851 [Bimuria novae-zelandiae CBS 107.79]
MSSNSHVSPEYLAANQGPHIITIITILPSVAFLVVSLRLYTRFVVVNNPSYEDLTIVLALVFSIAMSICQGYQVKNGMGRHIETLELEQGINSLKALFASIMMYNFGLTLTKASIVLQYIRITVESTLRKTCRAFLWIIFMICVMTFLTGIFTCYPVAKFWDDRIPGGCVSKPALWYTNAAINIATDIALIVIPMFIIRKLQLRSFEKYTLGLILGLGGFASIASVLRLKTLHTIAYATDVTWDNPGAATWSAIELNVGIICASLPTLRASFARALPWMFRSTWVSSSPRTRTTYTRRNESVETSRSIGGELIMHQAKEHEYHAPSVMGVRDIPPGRVFEAESRPRPRYTLSRNSLV